jgi:alcohol dehydrogenase (NADP+)
MAQTDYKFEGWMGLDPSSAEGKMVWQEFQPKEWEETDVDIKISHCGICGSDIHTLRSGWVCFMFPYQRDLDMGRLADIQCCIRYPYKKKKI